MPPAPQGPPPGAPAPGYGYPQQPPGQPGYGYPQQPGPYAQQPGPYNQQPGAYNQPGPYGQYPTQPQYPGAPAPGGGGGGSFFKGKTGIIVAASAAALLVVGGGTWYAVSSGDEKEDKPAVGKSSDDPKPTGSASVDQGDGSGTGREGDDDLNAGRKDGEAKVLFLTKNDVDLPRNGAEVFGPWVAGDTVVKAMYREVAGYSVTDGSKKWSVPLSAEVCSAPAQTSADGKIVIGVKDGLTEKAKCNDLQMIDLKTGKAGWKKPIPKASGAFASLSDFTLAISGTTLAVGGSGNSYGFSMADGKQLFGKPGSGCKPFAFAGGPKLLAGASCPTDDYDKPKQQLQEIDPASGKPRWTYNTPEGWEIDKVYSASPLVVSITQREPEKKWSIIALTDNGKLRSQISGGKNDKFQPRCGGAFVIFGQNLEGCTEALLHGHGDRVRQGQRARRLQPRQRQGGLAGTGRRGAQDDAAAHRGRQRPRLHAALVRHGWRCRHRRADRWGAEDAAPAPGLDRRDRELLLLPEDGVRGRPVLHRQRSCERARRQGREGDEDHDGLRPVTDSAVVGPTFRSPEVSKP
jgi:hypothetical protein